MPVLPISKRGQSGFDLPAVLAVMAYPTDERARLHFCARFSESVAARAAARVREAMPQSPPSAIEAATGSLLGQLLQPLGGFALLSSAPSIPDGLMDMSARVWAGSIVGDIVLSLLQMQAAGMSASVNKAIAIERAFLSGATTKKGAVVGREDRYIRNSWRDFKTVGHLWAVFRDWQLREERESFPAPTPKGLPGFLAVAEGLLNLALTLHSKGRKESLLGGVEMWRTPKGYPLPPVEFRIPPLEDWKLEALRKNFKSQRS